MINAARTVANSTWVPPAIFAVIGLVLLAFGLYLVVWASFDEKKPYLRTLSGVLALISFAFGGAMVYEAAALWTNRFSTISAWAHTGFVSHPIRWVAIYSALLLLVGCLGIVFTQVAQSPSPASAAPERRPSLSHAVLVAATFAVALTAAALAVTTFQPLIKNPANATPGFSWWVLYVGGATFGAGALVAWAFGLRPDVFTRPATPHRAGFVAAGQRIMRPAKRVVVAAQPLVRHERASATICAVVGVALLAFSLFMFAWGTVNRSDYLWPLCYVLATLSVAFAVALLYNAIALYSGAPATISDLADQAFSQHRVTWVAFFAGLLLGFGLLATHFTRVASFVSVEETLASITSPVVWSILFGLATVSAAVVVVRIAPPWIPRAERPVVISWWVISAGGVAYAAGALVAWATNWAP